MRHIRIGNVQRMFCGDVPQSHDLTTALCLLGDNNMIKWAIIFAIIGLIAGALGFGGMAGAAMGIAKLLFWAGIIIAIVLFVLGMTIAKKVT